MENDYTSSALFPKEKTKIPPKVAPKPKRIFKEIEHMTHDRYNPDSFAYKDDLYPDHQECYKDQIGSKNVLSDAIVDSDTLESKLQLDSCKQFPQVSDSCRSLSSGVYSISEPTGFVQNEKEKADDESYDPVFIVSGKQGTGEYYSTSSEFRKQSCSIKNHKSNIHQIKAKHCEIQRRLDLMHEKEDMIHEEINLTDMEFKQIEDELKEVARMYEVDKFKLHILEIEKIMNLILGLKHRISRVESSLDNFEWNSVDERDDLERKRDKIIHQLDEAKELWTFIDRRTGLVAGYIEHYFSYNTVIQFRQLVKNKVNQIVEMKKLRNKISQLDRILLEK